MTKTTIIVHCADTLPNWWKGHSTASKVREIKRWHTSPPRNWRDIAYARLIDRDGTVANGRDLDGDGDVFDEVGAHTKGFNTNSVGIMLFGGHGSSADDRFEDHFTPEQDAALRAEIDDIMKRFPTITRVAGHNEFAAKACPGFNVPDWWGREQPSAADAGQYTHPRTVLGLGDKGDDVKALQKKLGIKASGVFDDDTDTAVRAFQAAQGLTVDGFAGPKTMEALG